MSNLHDKLKIYMKENMPIRKKKTSFFYFIQFNICLLYHYQW